MSLWKMFLYNDGSMTNNLKDLFKTKIEMKLLENKSITYKDIENYSIINNKNYTVLLSSYFNDEVEIIYREIQFFNEKDLLLEGISFWNKTIYDKVMKDKNEAIGIVLINNKIEFFKSVDLDLNADIKTSIVRICKYYIDNQLAFILFENINLNPFEDIFGLFSIKLLEN